jgi:curved DNA-binding protein CbpA
MSSSSLTHYTVLAVSTTASDQEIHKAFRGLAHVYHPDRNEGNSEKFTELSEAYDILSNPLQRALYDLDMGITPESNETMNKIHCLRRAAAMKELRNLIEKSKAIAAHEASRKGLIIVDAKYGDINALTKRNKSNSNNEIDILDVTLQLQSFVSDSAIIMKEGQSKSWIEGFYDVCEGKQENELYVVYKLGNKLHSSTVGEFEELVIPQPCHVMSSAAVYDWENQFRRKTHKLQAIKSRRRIALYTGLALAGLGLYYFTYAKQHTSINNIINQWIQTLTEWAKFAKANNNLHNSQSNSTLLTTRSPFFKDQFVPISASAKLS